jgi:hypothetical protein
MDLAGRREWIRSRQPTKALMPESMKFRGQLDGAQADRTGKARFTPSSIGEGGIEVPGDTPPRCSPRFFMLSTPPHQPEAG